MHIGVVNIYIIFTVMGVITYSNGIIIPNIVANIVSLKPQLAGAASGLSGCVQYTMAGMSTYISALLVGFSIYYMPLQLIFLSLVGTFCFFFGLRSNK